eukprot:scaffold164685_cov30-Tisochrysis_lutea.AAC.2
MMVHSRGGRAFHHLLKLATLIHLDEQVAAANKLTLNVALGDRRPVRIPATNQHASARPTRQHRHGAATTEV